MSNDEYDHESFFEKSKHFNEDEVKGYMNVDGKRVVYLKEGVKRKRYNDNADPEKMEQLNQEMISYEKWTLYYQLIMGIDDFSNN